MRPVDPSSKLAILLLPFFGRWPEWIAAYLESCRWNSRFDYLIFSDCGSPELPLPDNVSLLSMTLDDFNEMYVAAFPERRRVKHPYKICDVRPAFGLTFKKWIVGYPYFGWGDVDVIYGDLCAYLTEEMLAADVISFNRDHVSGHLTLARTSCADALPEAFPNWFALVDDEEYRHLDEPEGISLLRLSAQESFNTPLSILKPWTDGRFVFPEEWYWRAGVLTNNLDGARTFPYLHFMHWKGGAWPRECGNAHWERLDSVFHLQPEQVASGFRINARGFFPLDR